MKFPRALLLVLATLFTSSLPAWADPGFRLVPITDGASSVQVFDLNERGDVVGMKSAAGETHAFRWRAGTFTDLHEAIDLDSSYTQAAAINDRATIVGDEFTVNE